MSSPFAQTAHPELCRQEVVRIMAGFDCEVVVSTEPPLFPTPYDPAPMKCPHGTTFYLQPTNDQILRWMEAKTK